MKQEEIITSNLVEFGYRERVMLVELLNEWNRHGLPYDFEENDVNFMFNKNSGHVFLTNSEYQVAMINDGKLEIWNSCANCGCEGFKEDCALNGYGCNECKEGIYE